MYYKHRYGIIPIPDRRLSLGPVGRRVLEAAAPMAGNKKE